MFLQFRCFLFCVLIRISKNLVIVEKNLSKKLLNNCCHVKNVATTAANKYLIGNNVLLVEDLSAALELKADCCKINCSKLFFSFYLIFVNFFR